MRSIKEDGYAIIPDVLTAQDVDRLLADLSAANAPRSRAGSRHALRHAAVRTLAESSPLIDLAHLDDSLAENGPLRVLSGTHTRGVLSDDEIHECAERISPVECLVGKGGVVAMRPLIIHASSKSRSDVPRRVLHVEYAESQEIADGFVLAVA
jgi:Phytanoyl-CoA dioxygenase (PhyH)